MRKRRTITEKSEMYVNERILKNFCVNIEKKDDFSDGKSKAITDRLYTKKRNEEKKK